LIEEGGEKGKAGRSRRKGERRENMVIMGKMIRRGRMKEEEEGENEKKVKRR
tara:strand:- start:526 stop:681 length:156 start_codon:yes stop_codon:yes gene_type:complete